MAKIILFGGGDGGGLMIGPNGVTPIPPFDPAILLQLRAVSTTLKAMDKVADAEVRRQLHASINKFSNLVVGQIEDAIGPIDAEEGIIYQDDDGGFTCGSTGKPPIPLPWPPQDVPSLQKLVATGLVKGELTGFLTKAAEKDANLLELFSDPRSEAKRIGLELPNGLEHELRALSLSEPEQIEDPVDREIVSFFRAAVTDGRYLKEWATRPAAVADQIGLRVSRAAIDRISAASSINLGTRAPGSVMSPYGVAVVVVIVIVVWTREERIPVRDRSGIEKF